jgi:RsiW-degrading membrane proteinase PrsW (M82 family)
MSLLTVIGLIVLGLLPSFAWLVFYLHEDLKHPQPKKLIAETFFMGCVVTYLVLKLQLFVNPYLIDFSIGSYSFMGFVVFAAIEEICKFGAVYLFVHKLKQFNEPLDAMLYMIVGGLGFAAIENIALLFQAAQGSIWNIALVETVMLRFVGATLLHSLSSGLVGYYWGLGFFRPDLMGRHILEGLTFATLLHAIFNYLIITTGPATFAVAFVFLLGFFVLNDFEKFKRLDT